MDSLWNIYSIIYDKLNKLIPYQNMLYEVYETLNPTTTDFILDAGCGTGNLAKIILQNVPNQNLVVSDNNIKMIQHTQKKNPKIIAQQIDLNKVSTYNANTFDAITLINVLYAVQNPIFTLTELHRILKPKGKIILVNPAPHPQNINIFLEHCRINQKPLKNIVTFFDLLLIGLINNLIVKRGNRRKFHFLSNKELHQILKKCGFRNSIIKKTYAGTCYLATAFKA